MNESRIDLEKYTHIIGVFRAQAQADEAIAALEQADFTQNNILTTEYHSEGSEDMRVLVHVMAVEREQEAVEILVHHGANNADLPPGTEILNGDLVSLDAQVAPPLTHQPTTVDPEALPANSENQ